MSRVAIPATEDRAQLGIAMMLAAWFFFSLIDTSVKWLVLAGLPALHNRFVCKKRLYNARKHELDLDCLSNLQNIVEDYVDLHTDIVDIALFQRLSVVIGNRLES